MELERPAAGRESAARGDRREQGGSMEGPERAAVREMVGRWRRLCY